MTTLNEFQNAADRVRPFATLVTKAHEVWEILKELDEAKLAVMVQQREQITVDLERAKAEITAHHLELANLDKELAARKQENTVKLENEYRDKSNKLSEGHMRDVTKKQQIINDLDNTINAEQEEIRDLKNQKGLLTEAIAALQKQFNQIRDQLNA